MRICITSQGSDASSPIDERFGRCSYLVIYDSNTNKYETISNPGPSSEHGAGIAAAQAVIDNRVDVLITGHLGPNALGVIAPSGIKTYRVNQPTVGEARAAFQASLLEPLQSHD